MTQPSGRLSHLERLPGEEEGNRRRSRPAALFMAAFLAGCLLISLLNPALLDSPNEPLLDGSWAAAYQSTFDEQSLLLGPAKTVWGVLEYTLFGQGRPGVLVGANGWLFSREEFVYPDNPAQAASVLATNLDRIEQVDNELADRGIDLVVALLPAKARIYPEHLGRYRLPQGPQDLYRLAHEGLRSRSVRAVDLQAPLLEAKEQGEVFLRTDTHWTPFGAAIASEAVALELAASADYPWLDSTDFVTNRGETSEYRGDLTRFLPLGPFYQELGPPDDRFTPATTLRAQEAGNDLFAAVELPVVLVGTSYSDDERWNFTGYLQEALGSDVLAAAQEGRGPYRPMLDYLSSEAISSSPPDVVVWEIPERYLSQPWQEGENDR